MIIFRKTLHLYKLKLKIHMKNFLIFGPPGSGKGTYSKVLAEKLNLEHLSTGDIIRDEIKKDTEFGRMAKGLIDAGNFVPDKHIIQIVVEKLTKMENKDGFVLDGFPRTVQQAKFIDKFLFERRTPIKALLNLRVSKPILFERISKRAKIEGRPDDADNKVIHARLNKYENETLPVLNYFETRGKIININSDQSIDDAINEILGKIEDIT